MSKPPVSARRVLVRGVVQGVGFRPFIYGLAQRLELCGWVRNTSAGVEIEVEGTAQALDAFVHAIRTEAPPLARVEHLHAEPITPNGYTRFEIRHSAAIAGAYQLISPDVATCEECLAEIFDPHDRRYRYAFTNCTNCGPRFTIIRDIPYDRPLTTMAAFPMCADCQREYDDPLDRRFHAQPNACPTCGPQLELRPSPRRPLPEGAQRARSDGAQKTASPAGSLPTTDPIAQVRELLRTGHVVAVKGLGGFHLACDATDPQAVETLRARKRRPHKPFAVMMPNLATVRRFCEVSEAAAALLSGKERPIVLLPLRPDAPIAPSVAPGLHELGVMLPYTPLHHLLLEPAPNFPPALVMTSGNLSDEPIVTENEAALQKLAALADAFLLHDRAIHVRCDDSVLRVRGEQVTPIRRSRGYVPEPLPLPFDAPPLLAVGAELKNTFCLARERHAFPSQHIGDLSNYDALQAYERAVAHMEHIFRLQPQMLAHDLHPDYMATRYAERRAAREGLQRVAVQHHHAHLAACMAEHALPPQTQLIGVIFDGTGLGTDGAIWGGEILLGGYEDFRRFAHLRYIPLPGGDAATLRPYRVALAHLWAAGLPWADDLPPVQAADAQERAIIAQQLEKRLNAPLTSSMGRLFDAAAALIGVLQRVSYEAQAAIWLEAQAVPREQGRYPLAIVPPPASDAPYTLDPAPLWRALLADLRADVDVPRMAARFHNGIAEAVQTLCRLARDASGLSAVALSGGVFQNAVLLERTLARLEGDGFTVYTHRRVPPNDGGLAMGQAAIAAFRAQNPSERR